MTNAGVVKIKFSPPLKISRKEANKIRKSHNEVFGPGRKRDK